MLASDPFEDLLAAKLEESVHQQEERATILTAALDPASVHIVDVPAIGAGPTLTRQAPARHFSAAERDALTALRRLGAALADDFDTCQLKAAFRRLALQLHPDRHPDADCDRRRWLGTRFAVLCEAYRTLSEPLPHP